jgi:hypothetical protein
VQVRHAQGIHNVAGEKDYNAYMSEELLDAQLTPLGWSQVSLRVSFSQVHGPCMPSSHRPWPYQFCSQRVRIVVVLLFLKYLLRWQCLLSFVDMIIAICKHKQMLSVTFCVSSPLPFIGIGLDGSLHFAGMCLCAW